MNKQHRVRYGGAITGAAEEKALIKSIKKSRETGNWQLGEEAEAFCKEAAEFLGVKYALICNSGTSAGMLALASLELPKGSGVIIPATTFPTIFNIIPQLGLEPIVVDCVPGTYNLNLDEVQRVIDSRPVGAIIAVHAVGNPVDMPRLMEMVKSKKIYVVEDNCDGWGSTIGGRRVGSFGDISFTSFHAAHIVSMGVGGGVFTNDDKLARNAGMYRDWGRQANLTPRENTEFPKLPKDQNPRFIYEKLGYNFNMLELQAAMGRVQLKKTEKIKKARKRNFDYLYKELSRFEDLVMPTWVDGADVCWFSFPLSIKSDRAPLLSWLENYKGGPEKGEGIETRTMFAGNILRHPGYGEFEHTAVNHLPGSNWITEHSFWIGLHPRDNPKTLKYVVQAFEEYFAQKNVKTS